MLASLLLRYLDKWRISLVVFAVIYGAVLSMQLAINSMMWDEVTHFTGGLLLSRGQVSTWVLTNSLYPPIYDVFTAIYYLVAGPSVFAGRLVAVTFCVLSLFVIYEFAHRIYSQKTAFLAAVLFSVMPGIVWISRMAMIETLLVFVFSLCLLFFYNWLTTGLERDRKVSIVLFAIGAAVKYQTLVVIPLIMLLALFFWKRAYLKDQLKRCLHMPRIAVIGVAGAAAAVVFGILLISGVLNVLFFAISVGTTQKAVFSVRYPVPIFYLIEMTWFDNLIHPISLMLYVLAILGLGLMAWRRKPGDKFLLLWFIVVYAVFTLIPNREWRYVTIAFPVLAISTASFLATSIAKLRSIWRLPDISFAKKWGAKIATGLLIAFILVGGFFSCVDSYNWVTQTQVTVPIDQAVNYAAESLPENQSLAVVCPLNRFNMYSVRYYLSVKIPNADYNQVWQYPAEAVDAYKPDFKAAEFTQFCQQHNAKCALIYEFSKYQYFNSTQTAQSIINAMVSTGRFTLEATFGSAPDRVFVYRFMP